MLCYSVCHRSSYGSWSFCERQQISECWLNLRKGSMGCSPQNIECNLTTPNWPVTKNFQIPIPNQAWLCEKAWQIIILAKKEFISTPFELGVITHISGVVT